MAELPTPHSIAIGTLIALYSDPNSPLLALDWQNVGSSDRSRRGHGRGKSFDGRPRSTAEWSLRLMSLIQQLVLKEDEGIVILPNSSVGSLYNVDVGDNPAAEDTSFSISTSHTEVGKKDPIDLNNIILDDDDYFMKKHAALMDGQEVLDDVLGMFGSSLPSSLQNEQSKLQSSGIFVGNKQLSVNAIATGGSLNFCMETLSTLLDRIDAAFTSSSSSRGPNNKKQQPRTPPSLALLSRLQMASTSVDHLMNLLDEWHSLLAGVHMGYPPPASNPSGIGPISIDGESTFGVYLRKLCLGMEEIPFEALSRLWDALRKFVTEEIKLHQGCENQDKGLENARGGDEYEQLGNTTSDWLPSSPQIERIVRNTCLEHNLDALLTQPSHRGDHGGSGDLSTLSTSTSPNTNVKQKQHQQLYNLLETHPECPSLHFLLYLSSLANGQRSQALESLHRYFDYAMIHERKERAERAFMIQASGGDGTLGGSGGGAVSGSGLMGNMSSGMGGITGGMTGGITTGVVQAGGGPGGQQQRGGAGAGGNANQTKMFKESNVMQYAAILLAQTYYRFGYTQLSLQATEEAIRVAQQSGDGEAVCFANGWLALVSSSLGAGGDTSYGVGGRRQSSVYASVGGLDVTLGNVGGAHRPLAPVSADIGSSALTSRREEEAMLSRCQARASERGLSSLAAGASLELARRLAYRRRAGDEGGLGETNNSGDGCVSNLAWDSIQSASTIRGRAGGHQGGTGSSQAAPTDIYNMTPTEATSIIGRQNVAIGSLWDSTGHASLASLSSCAALVGSGVRGDDEITKSIAVKRMLSSFSAGPSLSVWGGNIEIDKQGDDGRPRGEAYSAILNNLMSFGYKSERHSSSSMALSTMHEWCVRSYDLSLAKGLNVLLANHAAFPSSSMGGALPAVESSLMSLVQSTHLSCQVGEYDKARACARRACWLANQHGLLFHLGWNLIQLALIDLEAATSAPERALPPLLECLDLAERYSMDPLQAIALATLAKVLLCMGGERYQKARALLQSAMPLVMQHGHVWFQGEACLTLAKCYLAEVNEREDLAGSIVVKLRESALSELTKSALHFEQIEDIKRLRQVYYLQARVYQVLPNTDIARIKREEAAKVFAQLTLEMRERAASGSNKPQQKQQWDILRSVMIR